jgi:hypothetical protein
MLEVSSLALHGQGTDEGKHIILVGKLDKWQLVKNRS